MKKYRQGHLHLFDMVPICAPAGPPPVGRALFDLIFRDIGVKFETQ